MLLGWMLDQDQNETYLNLYRKHHVHKLLSTSRPVGQWVRGNEFYRPLLPISLSRCRDYQSSLIGKLKIVIKIIIFKP